MRKTIIKAGRIYVWLVERVPCYISTLIVRIPVHSSCTSTSLFLCSFIHSTTILCLCYAMLSHFSQVRLCATPQTAAQTDANKQNILTLQKRPCHLGLTGKKSFKIQNDLFISANGLQNRPIYQKRKSNVNDSYQSSCLRNLLNIHMLAFLFRPQFLVSLAIVS